MLEVALNMCNLLVYCSKKKSETKHYKSVKKILTKELKQLKDEEI